LQSLDLNIDDVRGQGYDNGSNMKGRHQGVRAHVLEKGGGLQGWEASPARAAGKVGVMGKLARVGIELGGKR
jgi:hypothetical protein